MASRSAPERRWVEIGFVVLEPSERTGHMPEDTRAVPYYVRLKGFAEGQPQPGEIVTVETLLGRRVEGEVLRVDPECGHGFGQSIEELIDAGREARMLLATLEDDQ